MATAAIRQNTYEEFLAFHAANPAVYNYAVKLCREEVENGRKHWSPTACFSVIRFNLGRIKRLGGDYDINNDFIPYYSRLIQMQEPDLEDFFETRTSVADADMDFAAWKARREREKLDDLKEEYFAKEATLEGFEEWAKNRNRK
ncbi:MAG TPA: hypothetical protein VN577_09960 [Terriglobales bacterium]|nr:hypothetical protein [Terriglobales bacterium]